MKCKVIWIDDDPNSKEKLNFAEKINSLGSYTLKKYINVDSAIEFMKGIEFEETKIIISDKLYFDFVKKFKENILNMRIAPKIIIFSKNKQIFVSNNRNYLNIDIFIKVMDFIIVEESLIHFKKLINF